MGNSIICRKCHRVLSDPESIERGYGPICWGRFQKPVSTGKNTKNDKQLTLSETLMPSVEIGNKINLYRVDGKPQTNIPHRIVKHSPDGFEWGYSGSGPADLALNILACVIGQTRAENRGLYQEFKRQFISTLPESGGTIDVEDIRRWINEFEEKEA